MISELKERLVLWLIRDGGLSERQMADRAGVARGTVRRRKAGYRGRVMEPAAIVPHARPACPICGATLSDFTDRPCLACQLRIGSP